MHASTLTPDQRATRSAARQYGLLTHAQALAAGLSQDMIDQRVRSGRWRRVAVGLYLIEGAPASWRRDCLAAVLAGPPGTLASHLTAAALHAAWTPPPLPHVLTATGRNRRGRLALVHAGVVPNPDRCIVDGIPCTTPSRTLVDAAGMLEREALEALTDDLLCSGRASTESVQRALERAGRRGRTGVALLEAVLEVWVEDITPGSPAEVRLLRRLEEWGVDDAVTQYEIHDHAGLFVARVDVASPKRQLAFEYDSDRWHNPRRWAKDEPRHERLKTLGWQVEHANKLDLLPSATRIRDLVDRRGAG